MNQCEQYFRGTAADVEQPFQPRLAEGMIRAYLTHGDVVGFTHQYPRGLMPPGADDRPSGEALRGRVRAALRRASRATGSRVGAAALRDRRRRRRLAPGDLGRRLPVRAADPAGEDSYVLCEINASSTFAFPELAMPGVARAALDAIRLHHRLARASSPDPAASAADAWRQVVGHLGEVDELVSERRRTARCPRGSRRARARRGRRRPRAGRSRRRSRRGSSRRRTHRRRASRARS